ncbi:hypothetical protein [Pusillimonas sp. ANT_WB101]|uniref:hypothetical protein n=1 Tax=Pusillimonas sp. ANT_WB101 TaxID=2597356 RepID=UPI0011EC1442|nr:hypothetical protein [Pusillimonas sp. ANT_WB101]KAA0910650.1 hypothetical protein FQ179_01875 [Pusillimonas sp. ANT_WB101]
MKEEFKSYCREGAHKSIVINNNDELSNDQYVATLRRIRKTIADAPLAAVDSNTPGDKYTASNWGLCSELKEHYPSPELHTFPMAFVDHGRMSALSCGADVKCPMRVSGMGGSGCFYDCRVFSKKFKTPSQEEALRLFDAAITKATT